ncbi:hypothetical protein [Kribbella solani]|uniref:D-alanyl-D-alanine carboxypeptidase n=1 Tax=Kribbella solani TaxID=236067 RepID=A0A841DQ05_9ACTN|nr:hypothetical protein [Kribbella solani]MBB5978770.1 hypothetical protein [Kribbella solani]MDX2968802.1 hypothetical protein [Kribbella solani]MDX3000511.1 hypothetical protein [Kribbella solani]
MTNSIALTAQDKTTLAVAAHGSIALIAAAGVKSAGKIAVAGSLALASATGPVGHALDENQKGLKLDGKSTAELADQVFPALTAAMHLLKDQDAATADDFRGTVLAAVEAGSRAERGGTGPAMTEMIRKITNALDA